MTKTKENELKLIGAIPKNDLHGYTQKIFDELQKKVPDNLKEPFKLHVSYEDYKNPTEKYPQQKHYALNTIDEEGQPRHRLFITTKPSEKKNIRHSITDLITDHIAKTHSNIYKTIPDFSHELVKKHLKELLLNPRHENLGDYLDHLQKEVIKNNRIQRMTDNPRVKAQLNEESKRHLNAIAHLIQMNDRDAGELAGPLT